MFMKRSRPTVNRAAIPPAKEQLGFLALPDYPDFVSTPPNLPLWANVILCEEMLPFWNQKRSEELAKLTVWTEPFYL